MMLTNAGNLIFRMNKSLLVKLVYTLTCAPGASVPEVFSMSVLLNPDKLFDGSLALPVIP